MKKLLVSVWPLIFIIVLWAIFASPFLLKGKVPFPADYQVTFFPPWSQYAQFNQPVKNNAMPDVVDQLYPWKHLVITDWKNGEVPLWNPYNFAGTPLLANYQSAPFTPLNILFFFFSFTTAWSLLVLLQPLLAGVGMYVFVRKLSVSQFGSLLSSLAWMFCGFLVSWMGYGTLGYAIGVLPVVLFGLEGYQESRKDWYLVVVALGLAFSFLSGHFQISLYALLFSFAYFIFRFIQVKEKRTIIFVFIALILGIFISLVQILPSIIFYSQSLRSTLFARPEVIPWQYLLTSFAPDFFGNPVTRNNWLGHYAEWASYIGVIPLLFALFSLVNWKNNFVKFFSISALVALFLATPTFLGDLILYSHIPVLSTSAASRIIALFSFSLAVLAGFGLDSWVSSQRKKLVLSIFGVILLLLGWTIIFGKIGLSVDKAIIARQNFLLPSIFLGIGIVAGFCGIFLKNKKVLTIFVLLLLLISAFDLYRFASKWQSFTAQNLVFPDVGVTNFFKTIKNQRVLGNYGGQVSLYYELSTLEGYDALYPSRIGEFASYVADGTLHPASRSVVEFPKTGKYSQKALNLLGYKYIVHKVSDTDKPWAYPFWKSPQDFQTVYQDGNYIVLENKNAFPRVFLTQSYIHTTEKENPLEFMFTKSIDLKKTIVLEEDPHINSNSSFAGSANVTLYKSDTIKIATKSNADSLLFLSDTFFPGWRAYVDGRETPILRADYAFRSIVVPSGIHTVIFSYWSSEFVYGGIISLVGLLLLVFLYFFQKRSV